MTLSIEIGGIKPSVRRCRILTLIKSDIALGCHKTKRQLVVNRYSGCNKTPIALLKNIKQG